MSTGGTSFYEILSLYPDEASAIRYFESKRWPNGVTCPKCGSVDVLRGVQKKRRRQLWYCHDCEHMFSVTSGTILRFTKLPLRKWLLAWHLMGASKKGISCRQVARMRKVTLPTAWHLCHRIRETMAQNDQLFTGEVESDELYVGGVRKGMGKGYRGNKMAVQTIVKRNTPGTHDGQAQTMALNNGQKVDGRTVGAKLRKHTIPSETILMTDDSPIYNAVARGFMDHHSVNHSKEEYVRLDADGHLATTNSAEGLFANLRRQLTGTHHHTSHKHLPRYLEEFDFKYNLREKSDGEIVDAAIGNIEGKRLTLYKSTTGSPSLIDYAQGERPGKKRKVKRREKTSPVLTTVAVPAPMSVPANMPPVPTPIAIVPPRSEVPLSVFMAEALAPPGPAPEWWGPDRRAWND